MQPTQNAAVTTTNFYSPSTLHLRGNALVSSLKVLAHENPVQGTRQASLAWTNFITQKSIGYYLYIQTCAGLLCISCIFSPRVAVISYTVLSYAYASLLPCLGWVVSFSPTLFFLLVYFAATNKKTIKTHLSNEMWESHTAIKISLHLFSLSRSRLLLHSKDNSCTKEPLHIYLSA